MVRKIYLMFCFILCVNAIFWAPLSYIEHGNAAEAESFQGTWVANGSKEVLSMGKNGDAALFRLAGHVNLKDPVGEESDYWSECIGLAHSETGSKAHCVWRGLNNQEIYITLQGNKLAEGSSVTGKIVGGTGAAFGISGSVRFKWTSMSAQSANDVTAVGGYAKGLQGTYQLP